MVRLGPLQKQRIVRLLRKSGHVAGNLRDGVNDAPALRKADVGLMIDTAVDLARESADGILLDKDCGCSGTPSAKAGGASPT